MDSNLCPSYGLKEEIKDKNRTVKLSYRVDQPTCTGRIYSRDILVKAMDESLNTGNGLYIVRNLSDFEDSYCVPIIHIIGNVIGYNIDKDGEVNLEVTPRCLCSGLFDGCYKFSTYGVGLIDRDNITVKEFRLIALYIAGGPYGDEIIGESK